MEMVNKLILGVVKHNREQCWTTGCPSNRDTDEMHYATEKLGRRKVGW